MQSYVGKAVNMANQGGIAQFAWYMITRAPEAPMRMLRSGRVVYTGREEEDFQRFCRNPVLNRLRRGIYEGDVFYAYIESVGEVAETTGLVVWWKRFVRRVEWIPTEWQENEAYLRRTGLGGDHHFYLFPGGAEVVEELYPYMVGYHHLIELSRESSCTHKLAST